MVLLAPTRRSLQTPWPDDFHIGGYGFRGGYFEKDGTKLVGEVPPDQGRVAPAHFGETAIDPIFGAPLAIRNLTRGYGQRRLRGLGNGRYWYTLNARCRAGRWILGPSVTSYTPGTLDATNGIDRFFEIGGRIFALNGRYCLTGGTNGTGWTVSQDLGVGEVAADVIVFRDNSGAVRHALVGMGNSTNFWYFTGATATTVWTQTAGGNAMQARAWAADTTTLFRVDDNNRLNTVPLTSAYLTAANWAAGTDRIGGYDQPVVRMKVNNSGSLLVCKQDDIHTLQADGSWKRLFEELSFPPSATNGEAMARWVNATYVTYGNATYRLSDDGGLTQIGPELLGDNGSEVRGFITAMVGTDYFLLAGLWNPDTSQGYLMEYTGEVVQDEEGREVPVWHGSIIAAVSKKITALHTSTLGADTDHKMAYIGYANGTIDKYQLACTPDPTDCTNEEYSVAAGYVYLSRLSLNFPGQRKSLLNVTGEADNFSPRNYAQFGYRLAQSGLYVNLATNFNTGESQRVDFPAGSRATYIDPRITLTNTVLTESPQISGFTVSYQPRPRLQEVMSVNVLAQDGLSRLDGTPYARNGKDVVDALRTLANLPGGVTFLEPDGTSHVVTVQQPQRTTAWDSRRRPTAAYNVRLIEQSPVLSDFTPDDLPGLYIWYDTSQDTVVADGTAIGTWSDRSGGARNATASGTARPLYRVNGPAGRAYLDFDGVDDGFSIASLSFPTPSMIFMVVNQQTWTLNARLMDFDTASGNGFVLLIQWPTTPSIAARSGAGSVVSGLGLGSWGLLSQYFEYGLISALALNGGAPAYSSTNESTRTVTALYLGRSSANGNFGDIWLTEVIVYNRRLTASEVRLVEWYLGEKYAITVPGS